MKDVTIALALLCLLLITFCVPAQAEGFKFPTIPNPFKKPTNSTEPARSPRVTGARVSNSNQPIDEQPSSFSLPKPKLPKFDLPSLYREVPESSTTRSTSRTTSTRQSRSNHNRPAEPSVIDKFSRGTKSFFSKAKTTLMPWADDTASTSIQAGPPSGSGSRHSARTNRSRSRSQDREASASSGFTFPWSKPKPAAEERTINSASDFLKLPRPKYY